MKRAIQNKQNEIGTFIRRVTSNTFKTIIPNEMKTIIGILFITAAMMLTSCEGPIGPPGLPGDTFIGSVFEIQGDFLFENDYTLYYQFPQDFTVYESDVVLVYVLWEQADGLDVWRLLPQTVVLPEGVLQYNFDYTIADVQVFLEGTIDLGDLLDAEWKDQIFRIAVLPAEFANSKNVDIMDFNSIIKSPNLELNLNEKIDLNQLVK
ncbi:MAG: collagen-like protein [Bacteroidota bacterium]